MYTYLKKRAWDVMELVSIPCLTSENDCNAIKGYIQQGSYDKDYEEIACNVIDFINKELKERGLA